ncbi:hypothetical protein [Anthocerotibacter panamensis]|uniref:hypothetical protein n=1 Tax=Anthocerotibacter panamensis TaxID=2857077 RepID=UPI001C403B2F|nr:hypothetical protein [Anthocerotibacter panamensis]
MKQKQYRNGWVRLVLTASLGLSALPAPAQVLIPSTPKDDFTREALESSGQRPDPFSKIQVAKPAPIVLPPAPPVVGNLVKGPTTPVALSVIVKGFIASATETVALVNREGVDDIARVGDTILSAQVVAISPVAKTVTLKENGQYVVRSLEATP